MQHRHAGWRERLRGGQEDRRAQLLNYKESKGRGPSYVSVDKSGSYVLDANYGGGYIEIYSLAKDGSLDQQTAFVQHEGLERASSARRSRTRTGSAPIPLTSSRWWRTSARTRSWSTNSTRRPARSRLTIRLSRSSLVAGPRHLAFHPNGQWLYAVAGALQRSGRVQVGWEKACSRSSSQVKTLPADFTDPSTAAEIAEPPDGKFLYASNRGEDSLVVYAIDAKSGELTLKQRVPSRGKVPRYFTFDPTNKWFIVSNQEGGNVAVFSVDAKTGELTPKGETVALMKPMALAFLK